MSAATELQKIRNVVAFARDVLGPIEATPTRSAAYGSLDEAVTQLDAAIAEAEAAE